MSQFTQLINSGSRILHAEAGRDVILYPTGTGKNAHLAGSTIPGRANVQFLQKGRAMDESGNWRDIYTGRISLTFGNNPELGEQLAALAAPFVPDQWKIELDGRKYKIANPSADETAWEFDIKESI